MGLEVNEVAKAAANIERIRSFLAPRVEWAITPQNREVLARVADSLRSTDAVVVRLLGVEVSSEPGAVDAATALEPSTFDPIRLAKIADFSEQLARWFASHNGQDAGAAATELGRLHQRLVLTSQLLERMLRLEPAVVGPPPAAPPHADDFLPDPGPTPTDDDAPIGPAPVPLGPASAPGMRRAGSASATDRETVSGLKTAAQRSDELVLDPAGEEELLVMRSDRVELSSSTRRRLDEYLASEEVELSSQDRRNFDRKVLRWIEAIPIGQLMVIKITDLNGRPEPYARYQPRLTE